MRRHTPLAGCGKVVRQPEPQSTLPRVYLMFLGLSSSKRLPAFSEEFPSEWEDRPAAGEWGRNRKNKQKQEQRVEFQEEITEIFFPGKGEMCVKITLSFRALESVLFCIIILGKFQKVRRLIAQEVTDAGGCKCRGQSDPRQSSWPHLGVVHLPVLSKPSFPSFQISKSSSYTNCIWEACFYSHQLSVYPHAELMGGWLTGPNAALPLLHWGVLFRCVCSGCTESFSGKA